MQNVSCEDMGFIVKLIANLIKYLHFIIPLLLIGLIVFDISKVVVGKVDEKAKSDALNMVFKRFIYAIIIYLIPTILIFVFQQINTLTSKSENLETTPETWIDCFEKYYRGKQ